MRQFVHLHAHSEYSRKDGTAFIQDIIDRMKSDPGRYGKTFAITDHGNMSAVAVASLKAKEHGLDFIVGTEAYVCPDRFERTPESYHLILLAMNHQGYMNLCRLSTESYLSGFYRNPRMDYAMLREHNEGIIAMSACIGGEIAQHVMRGDYPKAKAQALMYADIFKDRYYLELQQHYIKDSDGLEMNGQNVSNDGLLRIHRETGIPLVATNDYHYVTRDMARAQTMVMGINFGQNLYDWPDGRYMLGSDHFYMKDGAEMLAAIGDIPSILPAELDAAIDNTVAIAARCEKNLVQFERWHLPKIHKPKGISETQLLWTAIAEGQAHRYGFADLARNESELSQQKLDAKLTYGVVDPASHEIQAKIARLSPEGQKDIQNRITRASELFYEFDVIKRMGFSDYMLIVWNIVAYAKGHEIPTGPGRGSAAGSRIAFATGITDVNPLRHHLLFERFLNEDRVSMPDIDLDFCKLRRGEVIKYIKDLYGEDKVSQIGTYMVNQAKGAIQDMARFMGLPKALADRITKMLPEEGFDTALEGGEDDNEEGATKLADFLTERASELSALIKEDSRVADLLRYAQRIEGTIKATSKHAAGVLISDVPLADSGIPMMIDNAKDMNVVTQFDMNAVGDLGFLKMDVLGLRTETVKSLAIQNVLMGGYGPDICDQVTLPPDQLEAIPDVAKATFDLISSGDTVGVFQLESRGMRQLMSLIKPETFEELSDGIALFRPGPIQSGMMDQYSGVNAEKTSWPEDVLPVLSRTREILIYQEQVMQLAQVYAGYSLKEADNLRRIIGKKNMEKMAKCKGEFVARSVQTGRDEHQASTIFDMVAKFAGYGFNASHSMAYGYIAFHTAYFKAIFPYEYCAAVLSSVDDAKKLANYVTAAKKYLARWRGTKETSIIAPADINKAGLNFKVEYARLKDGSLTPLALLFGLDHIKSAQSQDVRDIIAERTANGPFRSFPEFMERTGTYRARRLGKKTAKLNKKTLMALIVAGAFDSFAPDQDWMGFRLALLTETKNDKIPLSSEMVGGDKTKKNVDIPLAQLDEDMWRMVEREYLQTPVKASAKIDRIWGRVSYQVSDTSKTLMEKEERNIVWVGGVFKEGKFMKTKKGKDMWRGRIEDIEDDIQVSVFSPDLYAIEDALRGLTRDTAVIIKGEVNNYNGEAGIVVKAIYPLDMREQVITLGVKNSPDLKKRLATIMRHCERGDVEISLVGVDGEKIPTTVTLSVRGVERLLAEIANHGLHRRAAKAS